MLPRSAENENIHFNYASNRIKGINLHAAPPSNFEMNLPVARTFYFPSIKSFVQSDYMTFRFCLQATQRNARAGQGRENHVPATVLQRSAHQRPKPDAQREPFDRATRPTACARPINYVRAIGWKRWSVEKSLGR